MKTQKSFIEEVTELIVTTAPYPNKKLAFCGAISLMSLLVFRKVIFRGMSPILYILGLANSGSGKNWPRQVIAKLLEENGLASHLGDSFASGEAIEDVLYKQPSMLFLNDEFDTIVRSMANEKDNRYESVKLMLLKMFTSASGLYFCRRKASDDGGRIINMPSLVLFATATPQAFYEAVSVAMAQSGLLARMIVVDAGKRGSWQHPQPIVAPASITEAIQYWRGLAPGDGDLAGITPQPMELHITASASKALDDLRGKADEHYAAAEAAGDDSAMACWARSAEHAIKLAMLHACSCDFRDPKITTEGIRWAGDYALRQVAEMLPAVAENSSESPFDKLVKRLRKRVLETVDGISRTDLLRFSRVSSRDFDAAMRTLTEREEVAARELPSTGGRRPILFARPLEK